MRYAVIPSRTGIRTLATLYEQNVPSSSGPSTALKPGVRYQEEQQNLQVVGEEVKGSEGPHYQGMFQCACYGRDLVKEQRDRNLTIRSTAR